MNLNTNIIYVLIVIHKLRKQINKAIYGMFKGFVFQLFRDTIYLS